MRSPPETRAAYVRFVSITTRWMDNDAYGHMNNVVHYSLFDTAVNQILIEAGALDIQKSQVIGVVAETQCRYIRPISFPDRVDAGVRVAHIGNTSVRYEIALFPNNDDEAAAQGRFVHVYVDRRNYRPAKLPIALRTAVEGLRSGRAT
jgi:acyl-CoA thioester hydrolase